MVGVYHENLISTDEGKNFIELRLLIGLLRLLLWTVCVSDVDDRRERPLSGGTGCECKFTLTISCLESSVDRWLFWIWNFALRAGIHWGALETYMKVYLLPITRFKRV